MNRYPAWKYIVLLVVLLVALVYALPNIFGKTPAIQMTSQQSSKQLAHHNLAKVVHFLDQKGVDVTKGRLQDNQMTLLFPNVSTQQKAHHYLKKHFRNQYNIAMSLESAAPEWLRAIGAVPMRWGLDLQGGVHLLLQVDTKQVIQGNIKSQVNSVPNLLRKNGIHFKAVNKHKQGFQVTFANDKLLKQALPILRKNYGDYNWSHADHHVLRAKLSKHALHHTREYAVQQTIETLKRRINELGIAESSVQQQGTNQVAVDLPGIQDAAQAKSILGKTATLQFRLVDTQHDAQAAKSGQTPPGSELYNYNGRPMLLKDRVILKGNSINSASTAFDRNGRPSVKIRMSGQGESRFYNITGENVGKPLAVVYIETKSHPIKVNGHRKIVYKKHERVINVATIQSALGSPFQITGLDSPQEAKNLALLLRAGALVAPVTVIAEHNVGPSMGQQNIHQGMMSLAIGMGLVALFMLIYYSVFGLIADIALLLNLVFIVAVMSLLGAVLSFPGIAGIVLTLGMAVDANVLIFERIREELRNGLTVQAAIHAGYEKAFGTIVDANVTTLIAGIVLFSIGTGAIKGFAVTLTIGIVTSMLTSISYTRAIVNLYFGGKRLQQLPIGIRVGKHKGGNK